MSENEDESPSKEKKSPKDISSLGMTTSRVTRQSVARTAAASAPPSKRPKLAAPLSTSVSSVSTTPLTVSTASTVSTPSIQAGVLQFQYLWRTLLSSAKIGFFQILSIRLSSSLRLQRRTCLGLLFAPIKLSDGFLISLSEACSTIQETLTTLISNLGELQPTQLAKLAVMLSKNLSNGSSFNVYSLF